MRLRHDPNAPPENLHGLRLAPLLLAPLCDERYEGGERGWRLAAARVVQKRSGKRRAPVVEHADERAGDDRIAHVVAESKPETDTIEGCTHGRPWMIHDQL